MCRHFYPHLNEIVIVNIHKKIWLSENNHNIFYQRKANILKGD